jgi:hypothetical protein
MPVPKFFEVMNTLHLAKKTTCNRMNVIYEVMCYFCRKRGYFGGKDTSFFIKTNDFYKILKT